MLMVRFAFEIWCYGMYFTCSIWTNGLFSELGMCINEWSLNMHLIPRTDNNNNLKGYFNKLIWTENWTLNLDKSSISIRNWETYMKSTMNGKIFENLIVCYFMVWQMKANGLLTKTGSSTRMDCTQRSETSDKIIDVSDSFYGNDHNKSALRLHYSFVCW